MSNLSMAAWLAALIIGTKSVNRWRRSGDVRWLCAGYGLFCAAIAVMLTTTWLHGSRLDHWVVIGAGVYLLATVPWFVHLHRREIRQYGHPNQGD
jgi:hypothetical protein